MLVDHIAQAGARILLLLEILRGLDVSVVGTLEPLEVVRAVGGRIWFCRVVYCFVLLGVGDRTYKVKCDFGSAGLTAHVDLGKCYAYMARQARQIKTPL